MTKLNGEKIIRFLLDRATTSKDEFSILETMPVCLERTVKFAEKSAEMEMIRDIVREVNLGTFDVEE